MVAIFFFLAKAYYIFFKYSTLDWIILNQKNNNFSGVSYKIRTKIQFSSSIRTRTNVLKSFK